MEDKHDTHHIITSLLAAIDPFGGSPLNAESIYRDTRIREALNEALIALKFLDAASKRKAAIPLNAGAPWSQADDIALTSEFERGASVAEIAALHQRSKSAIVSRLVRLGKLAPTTPGNRETLAGVADQPL